MIWDYYHLTLGLPMHRVSFFNVAGSGLLLPTQLLEALANKRHPSLVAGREAKWSWFGQLLRGFSCPMQARQGLLTIESPDGQGCQQGQ